MTPLAVQNISVSLFHSFPRSFSRVWMFASGQRYFFSIHPFTHNPSVSDVFVTVSFGVRISALSISDVSLLCARVKDDLRSFHCSLVKLFENGTRSVHNTAVTFYFSCIIVSYSLFSVPEEYRWTARQSHSSSVSRPFVIAGDDCWWYFTITVDRADYAITVAVDKNTLSILCRTRIHCCYCSFAKTSYRRWR